MTVPERNARSPVVPGTRQRARGRRGITRRTVVAGGLLALVVAAAFSVVLLAIADLRDDAEQPRHSEEVLAAANNLERLVIDLETGLRGSIITGQERFLDPWERARAAFPVQAQALQRLTADPHTGHDDDELARRIAEAGNSYIRDYSVPTVEAARRDPASAGTAVTDQNHPPRPRRRGQLHRHR